MLSIVTISFRDMGGLVRTIQSVKRQDVFPAIGDQFEHIIVASGVSESDCQTIQSMCHSTGMKFAFNKDTGLYNAMNIGISLATGTHVIYLNGGDEFFERTSLFKILRKKLPGKISLFRVAQNYNKLTFLRPGLSAHGARKKYSHQGCVTPLNEMTPRYDESLQINSDTFWIQECMSLFPHQEHSDVIVKFELGGISNRPRLRTIWLRLTTNGAVAAFKELIKLAIYKAVGAERYYIFLSMRAGYDIL